MSVNITLQHGESFTVYNQNHTKAVRKYYGTTPKKGSYSQGSVLPEGRCSVFVTLFLHCHPLCNNWLDITTFLNLAVKKKKPLQ
jgi:hypothetical protein